ncbi:vesicular glutamate transporter 1-like [Mya arenaria]|uniref:vesicular glutamate transporter 1-like n=1 Tax=Mya arenaria TaxID=6604 RepID=UPI0022E4A18D|nr:vesicular glutamate transporter 1-like [Mya arenaria]
MKWPKKRHVKSSSQTDELTKAFPEMPVPQGIPPVLNNSATLGSQMVVAGGDPALIADDDDDVLNVCRDGTLKMEGRASARCFPVPKRVIVTMLLGLGMMLVYAMRTNVGVMVVMILDEQAYEKLESVEAIMNIPRVTWDARHVGFLHSVFYIGFIVTQIPAAFCTTLWPSNRMYGGCILVSALLNLLLPVCIENGLYGPTCLIRGCQGLAEGYLYPACYGVLRHWTAPKERSRQVSAVLSCAYAGAIVGFPLAGYLSHYFKWQYTFYVCGCMCVLWWGVWTLVAYEKPSHDVTMSDQEFLFLQEAQGQDVIDYVNLTVPWGAILTSLPVMAICLCHFVRHWVLGLMLTNEPLYLSQFGYNIAEAGALASVPHIAKMVMSFLSGLIADGLLNHTSISTTAVRKLLVGVGLGLEALGFLVLTLLTDGVPVIIVLSLSVGAFGLTTSGWSVNHYDLSTRHASSLVAITSTFGSIGAMIVPIVTGHLTVKQNLAGWNHVFDLTAGIILLATVFFLVFGSGAQQSWSEPPPNICLIQKTDPLARKPYKTHIVQESPPVDEKYRPIQPHTALVDAQSTSIMEEIAVGEISVNRQDLVQPASLIDRLMQMINPSEDHTTPKMSGDSGRPHTGNGNIADNTLRTGQENSNASSEEIKNIMNKCAIEVVYSKDYAQSIQPLPNDGDNAVCDTELNCSSTSECPDSVSNFTSRMSNGAEIAMPSTSLTDEVEENADKRSLTDL